MKKYQLSLVLLFLFFTGPCISQQVTIQEASLGEVEEYIGEHGHLPQMPSAAEVEADGADLGQMNRLLLQKVEELTLYIINLQKQLDELKSKQLK